MTESFTPPEFWSFKPFFTIQPVTETRDKQLKLWKDLILRYCMQSKIYRINPTTFPYFKNPSIDRELSTEAMEVVINYMISLGHAEWEDSSKASLRIHWKTPESLGTEIYQWACNQEILETVYTIYELLSGDEYTDSGFHGTDAVLFRRALAYLENTRKCKVISGNTPDEDGVKFLAVASL